MKAIVTVGVPGSGKSRFAREYCERNKNTIEINRDQIRMVCFNLEHYHDYKFSKEKEKFVTSVQERIIRAAAADKKDVIISDTNLNEKTRGNLHTLLVSLGYTVEETVFDVPFNVAVERDQKRRDKTVGRQVIWEMHRKFNKYINRRTYAPDKSLPDAFVFDIDGTLADYYDEDGAAMRSPFDWHKVGRDRVHEHVRAVLVALYGSGYKIVLLSGRDGTAKDDTISWLGKHCIPYDDFFMRETGNCEKDDGLKERLFFDNIAPKYNVIGVFDDRHQVCVRWAELKVPLFKVGCPVTEF